MRYVRLSTKVEITNPTGKYWALPEPLGERVMVFNGNSLFTIVDHGPPPYSSIQECIDYNPDSLGFLFNIDSHWYLTRRTDDEFSSIMECIAFPSLASIPNILKINDDFVINDLTCKRIIVSESMHELMLEPSRTCTHKHLVAARLKMHEYIGYGAIMASDHRIGYFYDRGAISTTLPSRLPKILVVSNRRVYSLSRQRTRGRRILVASSILNSCFEKDFFKRKYILMYECYLRQDDPSFQVSTSPIWNSNIERVHSLCLNPDFIRRTYHRNQTFILNFDQNFLKVKAENFSTTVLPQFFRARAKLTSSVRGLHAQIMQSNDDVIRHG
jgi:hypothetical protein